MQPTVIWRKSVEQVHEREFPLYQRSKSVLKVMNQINKEVMNNGYVVSVDNIPIDMMGEKEKLEIYVHVKDVEHAGKVKYLYVAGIYQFSMNHNINPNMWQGMAKGVYARSVFLNENDY